MLWSESLKTKKSGQSSSFYVLSWPPLLRLHRLHSCSNTASASTVPIRWCSTWAKRTTVRSEWYVCRQQANQSKQRPKHNSPDVHSQPQPQSLNLTASWSSSRGPASGSATAATAASGLEAPHGKHKHFPLQASHSPTVGKHDGRIMSSDAYVTRPEAQLWGMSNTVRFLS